MRETRQVTKEHPEHGRSREETGRRIIGGMKEGSESG